MLKTDNAVLATVYREGMPEIISGGVAMNALDGASLVVIAVNAGSVLGDGVVRVVVVIGGALVLWLIASFAEA